MKSILLIVALLCGAVSSFAQAAPLAANVGQTLTLTVNVGTGTAPFVFTWTKNDVKWTPPVAPVVSTDGKTCTVTIANAQLTDAGNYLVNVWNSAGNANTPYAAVTVAQVIILPGNVTLTAVAK